MTISERSMVNFHEVLKSFVNKNVILRVPDKDSLNCKILESTPSMTMVEAAHTIMWFQNSMIIAVYEYNEKTKKT